MTGGSATGAGIATPAPGRAFFYVCLVTGALHAVYSAARVLVSYRAIDLGGDAVTIGIITALFSLVPLVVAVQVGRAVDRDKAATILQAGVLLTLAAIVAISFSDSVVMLGLGNILLGFGQILAMVASQGFVPFLSTPERLDQRFAAWSLSVSIGQTVGLPVAGIVSAVGGGTREEVVTRSLWALFGVLLVATPFALLLRNPALVAEEGEDQSRQTVTAMVGIPGMAPAVFSSLVVLTSMDLVAAYLPLLGEELGLSVLVVTVLIAMRTGASIVSRAFMPALLRRVSRARLLVSATLVSALPMAALPFVGHPVAMGAMLLVAGFFWGIGQPMTMSWVAGLVTRHNRASALSLRLTGNRLGQVLVPLGAGAAASVAGVGSVFVVNGALLLASAAFTFSAVRHWGEADPGVPTTDAA